MTAGDTVILYDLPSKDPNACWSLNPWKTRMYLNFKKIPYETQWIEYPDIVSKLEAAGIQPNPPTSRSYTIPALYHPSSDYIMDSKAIANFLEPKYPEPSLHLDSPILSKVEAGIGPCVGPLIPCCMPRIPSNLLNPPSFDYFNRTRKESFGMSLEDLAKSKSVDQVWEEATPAYQKMAELLKENDEGPYFMGKTVSYADFVLVSMLHFFKRVEPDLFNRAIAIDPALKDVYDACAEWLARDDH